MPILACQRCGRQFEAKTKRTKYCTGECFRAVEAEANRRRRGTWGDDRRRASNLVWSAIWRGDLIPRPCEICGSTKRVDAHHDDYSRPLDVRWLCRSHHRQHHVAERRAVSEASQQGAA